MYAVSRFQNLFVTVVIWNYCNLYLISRNYFTAILFGQCIFMFLENTIKSKLIRFLKQHYYVCNKKYMPWRDSNLLSAVPDTCAKPLRHSARYTNVQYTFLHISTKSSWDMYVCIHTTYVSNTKEVACKALTLFFHTSRRTWNPYKFQDKYVLHINT
jgi:hypothetical protein